MLNRKESPLVSLPENIHIQDASVTLTSNGIPVYVIEAGTQDVVKIEFVFAAGNITSKKTLIPTACNNLLDEGTEELSAAELAEALDFYGAYLQTEPGPDWCSVSLYSLNKFAADALPFLEQLLTKPAFPESEIRTYARQGRQRLTVSLDKVDVLARRQFIRSLYGENHPYGFLTEPDDYDKLDRQSLKDFYDVHYKSGLKAVLVSGKPSGIVIEQVRKMIESGGFCSAELPTIDAEFPDVSRTMVEKADAVQSAIRIGRRLFNRTHPDYVAFSVLNTLLGGYFGSRLMANIREDKGYTYGIGSGIVSQHQGGYFFISTEVGATVREDAVREIYHEISRMIQDPVPEAELQLVKNYITGVFQRSLDGPFSLSDRHKMLITSNLNKEYLTTYIDRVREVTPETVQILAQKYLQPSFLTEVIAGK